MWAVYKGVCDYFGTTPTWDYYSYEVVTNTIPLSEAARACPKIRQVSVAPLFAETIQRIARGDSVMSLFSDQENLF